MPSSWPCYLSNFRISEWKRALKSEVISSIILIVIISNAISSYCKVKISNFVSNLFESDMWMIEYLNQPQIKDDKSFNLLKRSKNQPLRPTPSPLSWHRNYIDKGWVKESDFCWQSRQRGARLQSTCSELTKFPERRYKLLAGLSWPVINLMWTTAFLKSSFTALSNPGFFVCLYLSNSRKHNTSVMFGLRRLSKRQARPREEGLHWQ